MSIFLEALCFVSSRGTRDYEPRGFKFKVYFRTIINLPKGKGKESMPLRYYKNANGMSLPTIFSNTIFKMEKVITISIRLNEYIFSFLKFLV